MKTIERIVLFNFKRFRSFEVELDNELTVLVGDNEAGKSSILLALDIVLSGSRSKVESIGLESLFNNETIREFMEGPRTISKLPRMYAEVYLSGQHGPLLNGKNNSKSETCDGLRFDCQPVDQYTSEIADLLTGEDPSFPFEYYAIRFFGFSGESYSSPKKAIRHIALDSSHINNDYATREYTKSVYAANVTALEKHRHENQYRTTKTRFAAEHLSEANGRLSSYRFALRAGPKANVETDIRITENDIPIENKGRGRQCFIKTEFALQKGTGQEPLNVLLLEEPENHLSHTNMRKLVERLTASSDKQLVIATHSSLISSRLDLRRTILLNSRSSSAVTLKSLPSDTAKFFMKAPDNNILEFVLSSKVVLVEGDAEFILFNAFYQNSTGKSRLERDEVHVISVGGTSFKRYLDLAKLLNIRTAIIRDNDRDHGKNCVEAFAAYVNDHIRVFADTDPNRWTFEICVYEDNRAACDDLFAEGRVKLTVEEYMMSNKADAAFTLLEQKGASLVAPAYIQEAIAWIRQ